MLELAVINNIKQNLVGNDNGNGDGNKLTPAQINTLKILYVVLVILDLLLITWAIMRAIKCSSMNSDSRAIHLLFALVSPVFYIAFSYLIPGFCSQN
jgi:hypothetical protein